MIYGIGVDIVHVDRLVKWGRTPGLIERFFHPMEIVDAQNRRSSRNVSLAARFAAKEALGKALGTGLKGIQLKDIQVVSNHNGKPDIKVHGTAAKAIEASGAQGVFLSMTHERDNAVAVVILEI
ncbi:MAG: holo-ACP synthase [Spirochaetales bacterium]|nr:holo-ACP synthase [Spirochaetales bacterium]